MLPTKAELTGTTWCFTMLTETTVTLTFDSPATIQTAIAVLNRPADHPKVKVVYQLDDYLELLDAETQ